MGDVLVAVSFDPAWTEVGRRAGCLKGDATVCDTFLRNKGGDQVAEQVVRIGYRIKKMSELNRDLAGELQQLDWGRDCVGDVDEGWKLPGCLST